MLGLQANPWKAKENSIMAKLTNVHFNSTRQVSVRETEGKASIVDDVTGGKRTVCKLQRVDR